MRSATRPALLLTAVVVIFLLGAAPAVAGLYEEVLRNAGRENGVLDLAGAEIEVDPARVALGERLFADKRLSLGGDIACRSCHLDAFGSADGLPNAVGVGGHGEGPARANSDGLVVPRNTLPLWGRGGPGFDVFFWDGKVEKRNGKILSQFGDLAPSDDPLVVAVHLPFVEIREMVPDEPAQVDRFKRESVGSAEQVYGVLLDRILADPSYVSAFTAAYGRPAAEITFLDVADAIAQFIRDRFRLRPTRFSRFVAGEGTLSDTEIRGGLLFYGKGRCAACHRGPYFTDFAFHAVPLASLGFGKSGFGVDYGRFNATFDPADLYRFRTPPLINVAETAPYGHAGGVPDLRGAVIAHFDPLRSLPIGAMDEVDRVEFYKRLLAASEDLQTVGFLDDPEILDVTAFLRALSFSREPTAGSR